MIKHRTPNDPGKLLVAAGILMVFWVIVNAAIVQLLMARNCQGYRPGAIAHQGAQQWPEYCWQAWSVVTLSVGFALSFTASLLGMLGVTQMGMHPANMSNKAKVWLTVACLLGGCGLAVWWVRYMHLADLF